MENCREARPGLVIKSARVKYVVTGDVRELWAAWMKFIQPVQEHFDHEPTNCGEWWSD